MTVSALYKDQPRYTLFFVSWSGKKKGRGKKKRGPLPFGVLISLAVHDWFFRSGLFYSIQSMEQWHLLMCPFHWFKLASPFTRFSQTPSKWSGFFILPVDLIYPCLLSWEITYWNPHGMDSTATHTLSATSIAFWIVWASRFLCRDIWGPVCLFLLMKWPLLFMHSLIHRSKLPPCPHRCLLQMPFPSSVLGKALKDTGRVPSPGWSRLHSPRQEDFSFHVHQTGIAYKS